MENIKWIRPIVTTADYEQTCAEIEQIMDNQVQFVDETTKLAYLDALVTLAEAYETKHFTFQNRTLSLVEILDQALEQLNWTRKDLNLLLGANRVSEIYSGKRKLSLAQIRLLHQKLHIPAELLLSA
ncbi:MAG: hypothetical protein RL757_1429 [Bacteroidota bacterium]|jgi:HTH-type transcriptional regulator/antitoxin HigA